MERKGPGLREHQVEGVQWVIRALNNNKRALLCDEAGLGKTIQTFEALKHLKGPFLVVAPKHCLEIWTKGDYEKYYKECFRQTTLMDKQMDLVVVHYEFVLAAYKDYMHTAIMNGTLTVEQTQLYCKINNFFGRLRDELQEKFCDGLDSASRIKTIPGSQRLFDTQWGVLILDEVHRIKSRDSKQGKAIAFLRATHRLGLTGTPIMNNATELYTIWRFGLGIYDVNYQMTPEEAGKMLQTYNFGRSKDGIIPARPDDGGIRIVDWTDPYQRSVYVDLKSKSIEVFKRYFKTGEQADRLNFMTYMQKLRQVCLHPGASVSQIRWSPGTHPSFSNWTRQRICLLRAGLQKHALHENIILHVLECFAANDGIQPSPKMVEVYKLLLVHERLILFSTYRTFLEGVMIPWLEQIGISCALFAGGSKAAQQRALSSSARVICFVKQAGVEGLNLQDHFNVVVIMDPHFNYAMDKQASDRIDRIGQKRPVVVVRLCMKGSVDVAMLQMQKSKQDDIDKWTKDKSPTAIKYHGLFLEQHDTVK